MDKMNVVWLEAIAVDFFDYLPREVFGVLSTLAVQVIIPFDFF